MKKEQIAAQLYTVRDLLQNESDIRKSLKKIKALGYDSVQISGMAYIDEKVCKSILDENGLICCATHENGEVILDEPYKIIDRLKKLDCKYTAFPHPGNIPTNNHEEVQNLVERFNKAGEIYAQNGIILTYHNHHNEFRKINGRLILDMLYEDTDPKFLQGELDTYWVQFGGGSCVEYIKKLYNRLPLLHLKDYIVTENNQVTFAEIGEGNLNWQAIIKEAEKVGCKWFIVEQDTCNKDPFDSLKISLEYLVNNFC